MTVNVAATTVMDSRICEFFKLFLSKRPVDHQPLPTCPHVRNRYETWERL